jgi:lipid II:glycine glycyltransferase (peptidoglycan interpeptide bridge formation enzyme)
VPATIDAVLELVEWARSKRLAMLRVEPEGPVELREQLMAARFFKGPSVEPRHSTIVQLRDADAMLASFKRNTRYNIRLAERLGVTVREVASSDELSRQLAVTARRHGVRIEGGGYHNALVECLPDAHLYVASYEGVPLSASLVVWHDRRAYYLLAGSSNLRPELKPNYLLLWRAMEDAYAAGCTDIDLYGMPPPNDPTHPWHGLAQFKSGFSGAAVEYTGTWDIALSPNGTRVLKAWHQAQRRAERLGLRLRLLFDRLGQAPPAAGTYAPGPAGEPMAAKAAEGLNS